jgi:type I site-specific restriction-modification system R (restriction) subunit
VRYAELRLDTLSGKVMIVCMSRRICVDLYNAIVQLRPAWRDDALEAGAIKVVMTGSAADPQAFQPHIRSKAASKVLAGRFKDPDDPLKLLNDEIRVQSRRNVVQARSFAELLEKAIRRYQNRSLEAAQVVQQLVDLAKDIRAANQRGEQLGLSDDELAFYDALATNDSAVQALGDETLKTIARDLVETVRRNLTIDWTVKESVRAKLRVTVKRRLRKYGYPPDRTEQAVITILEQTELLSKDRAA